MWRISSCAIRGKSHFAGNVPCQDKVACFKKNEVAVVVLADGAGSAKMSHFGAELVTNVVGDTLCDNFEYFFDLDNAKIVKVDLVNICREALKKFADAKSCELRDLACTLLFAAVKGDKYIVGHIGDGVIGYMRDNVLKVASYPDNGEFANQTVFVTSSSAVDTMRLAKGNLHGMQGFVLMSDGSENSLFDKRRKILASIIKRLMTYTAVLPSNSVNKILYNIFTSSIIEKTRDDCSIAMLVNVNNNLLAGIIGTRNRVLGVQNFRILRKQFAIVQSILLYLKEPKSLGKIVKNVHVRRTKVRNMLVKMVEKGFVEQRPNGNFVGLIRF